jgi:hypothetical protein
MREWVGFHFVGGFLCLPVLGNLGVKLLLVLVAACLRRKLERLRDDQTRGALVDVGVGVGVCVTVCVCVVVCGGRLVVAGAGGFMEVEGLGLGHFSLGDLGHAHLSIGF